MSATPAATPPPTPSPTPAATTPTTPVQSAQPPAIESGPPPQRAPVTDGQTVPLQDHLALRQRAQAAETQLAELKSGQPTPVDNLSGELARLREEVALGRHGLTNPAAIDMARYLHSKLPEADRPALVDWYGDKGKEHPAMKAVLAPPAPGAEEGTPPASQEGSPPAPAGLPGERPGSTPPAKPPAPPTSPIQAATAELRTLRLQGVPQSDPRWEAARQKARIAQSSTK